MYNQHTRGMETTRHRSLVERGGRKALLETLHTHKKKKCQTKTNIHESKEKIPAHRASAKLLHYFLRKQHQSILYMYVFVHVHTCAAYTSDIHIYAYICLYICICISVYMKMSTFGPVCVIVYVYVYICRHVPRYIPGTLNED